jgi:predicted dehydrogenase
MIRAEAARPDPIDAVSIVTPNHLHYGAVRAFLEAGVHVICDKPLATTVPEVECLARIARSSKRVCAVTYNYSGYPLVRHAREIIGSGALGELRVVQVEYAQSWLAEALEESNQKQASWRTDPARAGVAGAASDIGTHAFHLAEFVTGLRVHQLAADLSTHVAGRRLDDNAQIMLRLANGARGSMWVSQVATGNENGLRLRVYGEHGGLEWSQEDPDRLHHARLGESTRVIRRAALDGAAVFSATRVPAGHPEGYIEAFAQLYLDIAELIDATNEGRPPAGSALLVPSVDDGGRGVRFIHAAVNSSRCDSAWVDV